MASSIGHSSMSFPWSSGSGFASTGFRASSLGSALSQTSLQSSSTIAPSLSRVSDEGSSRSPEEMASAGPTGSYADLYKAKMEARSSVKRKRSVSSRLVPACRDNTSVERFHACKLVFALALNGLMAFPVSLSDV